MTAVPKVSTCLDCGTPIIGDRVRCPACHDQHAVNLLAGDEDATLPRDRSRRQPSIWQVLVAWIAVVIFAVVMILWILAEKACQ